MVPTKKELLEENDFLRDKLAAIRDDLDEILEGSDNETEEISGSDDE